MLFYLLSANLLLLVSSGETTHNGQCDINKKLCSNAESQLNVLDGKKLMLYDVNPPEGFNLRRDVYMRFAIMFSEAQKRGERLDWHLVLPPWYAMYHWKTEYRDPPKPWNMFFDVQSLKTYAPVLELQYVLQNSGNYGFKIDSLYILQNFEDPFENGEFRDKWNVVGPCQYEGNFWGYHNMTAMKIICVEIQGSITQLWDIANLDPEDKRVMFTHGEIPLHSSYGTKTYWDCRKSMKFNSELIKTADTYIQNELNCFEKKCKNYLSVHWRRQDFYRANRSVSAKGTAQQIHGTIKKKSLTIKDVFVASDGTSRELKLLETKLDNLGYKTHFYLEDSNFTDGQLAIIEQIICSRSAYFIGTHESTFSYRIQEEREIIGFDSETTFNRLCPDAGDCERPSRWTIVH